MASAPETSSKDMKKQLSPNQLAMLVQAYGGMNESEVQSEYENLWEYFPKGYLTEEEFVAKFHEAEIFGKDSNFSPAKHLFNIIDRNKSGTVDLFEYLLGFALVNKQDPDLIMSHLFKVFDSDKDGLLSQAEVVDVLSTFYSLIAKRRSDDTDKKPDYSLDEIKNDVSKAFGDKTEISQKDLLEVCQESRIMQDFGMRLQTTNMLSMLVGDCCIQ